MNVSNGTQNDGSSTGTALGGAPAGASASAAGAQGGAGTSQGGGQPNTPPAGSFEWPKNWKENLPAELRDEGSLKVIQDIPSLAKSFIHSQKMIGADKIVIPTKHATDDDWKQVFTKLGNPEKIEDYKFEVPKDAPFDDKFVGGFKEIAHKAGILPKQAEGLVKWFAEASKVEAEGYKAQMTQKLEAEVAGLRQEWGNAFDAKIAKAQSAALEFGGKDFIKFLNETGLGNSSAMIKAFAKAADLLSEDKIGKDPGNGALTPGDAQTKITAIYGNKDHPYHHKSHPGHKAAVEEMQGLFTQKTAGNSAPAAGAGFIPYNSRS